MFCCVRPDNQNIRTWRAEVEAGIGRKQISIVNIFFTYSLCPSSTFGSWQVGGFLSPKDFSPFPISSLDFTFPTVQKSHPLHPSPSFFCCVLVLDHFFSNIPPFFVCSHLFTQRTLSSSPQNSLIPDLIIISGSDMQSALGLVDKDCQFWYEY